MVGVAFFQVGKQQIDGALIFLVVLAGFAGVDKFQQGNKVHFLGGGFVPDVAHQRAIQKPFCLYPKILRAFFSLTFGIRYQRMLIDRKMMKKELCELADVSPSTISKMGRGEIVSMEVIARICLKLNCTVDDILEILPDSPDYGTDEKIK